MLFDLENAAPALTKSQPSRSNPRGGARVQQLWERLTANMPISGMGTHGWHLRDVRCTRMFHLGDIRVGLAISAGSREAHILGVLQERDRSNSCDEL